jgi:hypothetical protein
MGNGRRALEQDDSLDTKSNDGDSRRSLSLESQERAMEKAPQKIYTDVPTSTEVASRLPDSVVAVGTDGQREPRQPIRQVENFDAAGKSMGTSDYIYPRTNNGKVQMNGYVDRDANGDIKEFAVRLPRLKNDESPVFQRDVFMVYRAKPGQPIDQESVDRITSLVSAYKENGDKKTPAEALRDQNTYFNGNILGGNMLRLRENQVIAVGLDPESGKRFTVRAQEMAEKQETPPKLTWFEAGKPGQMISLDRLSPADAQAIANASVHGNLRSPLSLDVAPQKQQRSADQRSYEQPADPRYVEPRGQQYYEEQRGSDYSRDGQPVRRQQQQQQSGQRYNGPLKR